MAEGLGVLSHAFFRLVFQNSVDRQWLKLFGNSRLESCGFARCAKKVTSPLQADVASGREPAMKSGLLRQQSALHNRSRSGP